MPTILCTTFEYATTHGWLKLETDHLIFYCLQFTHQPNGSVTSQYNTMCTNCILCSTQERFIAMT